MTARPVNYTTTIAASKTVGEMQALLAKNGATGVSIEYESGEPVALAFRLRTPHGDRHFRLPVDIAAMHSLLRRTTSGRLAEKEQAQRVAWRVVKDWLAAQLALVAANMASVDQVMLPYLVVNPSGQTLIEAYRDQESAAFIEGPSR